MNLAAWYPWEAPYEQNTHTHTYSIGIFIIGPVLGIRKVYDASALDIRGGGEEDQPAGWQLVQQVVQGPSGEETRRATPVTDISMASGSGCPLASYRPINPARMQQLLRWAFTPTTCTNSSAVAEVTHAATHDRHMFPIRPVDTEMGLASWSWSQMPAIKQKLVTQEKFDPELTLFRRGAHMPLMVCVGASGRRTPEARERREQRAEERGWGREAREAKGKGKKGRERAHAAGDPRGGGWTDGDAAGDLGSSMWGRSRPCGDAARDPRGGTDGDAARDPRGGGWNGWTDGDAARDPRGGGWNGWTGYRRTDGDAARDPRGGGWNEGTWTAVD